MKIEKSSIDPYLDVVRRLPFKLFVLAVLMTALVGVTSGQAIDQPSRGPVTSQNFQPGDLKKLAWIEGSWRGTGEGVPVFFERYTFTNDGALLVESFPDGAFQTVTHTSRYIVNGGNLYNTDKINRWVAGELTDTAVSFVPLYAPRNSFRWETKNKNEWTATMSWPASGNQPAEQRVYHMERWSPNPAEPVK